VQGNNQKLSENYVEKKCLLDEMYQDLFHNGQQLALLSGLSGSGKTVLAVDFA